MTTITEIRHFDYVQDTNTFRTTLKNTDLITTLSDLSVVYAVALDVNSEVIYVDLKERLNTVITDKVNNPTADQNKILQQMTIQDLIDYPIAITEFISPLMYRNNNFIMNTDESSCIIIIEEYINKKSDLLITNENPKSDLTIMYNEGIIILNGLAHRCSLIDENHLLVIDGNDTVKYTKSGLMDVIYFYRFSPITFIDINSTMSVPVDTNNPTSVIVLTFPSTVPDFTSMNLILSLAGSIIYLDDVNFTILSSNSIRLDMDALKWLDIITEVSRKIDIISLLPSGVTESSVSLSDVSSTVFLNSILDMSQTFLVAIENDVRAVKEAVTLHTKGKTTIKNKKVLLHYPNRLKNSFILNTLLINSDNFKNRHTYRLIKRNERRGLNINNYTVQTKIDKNTIVFDRLEYYSV